jgi:hypothetical protein
MLNGRSKYIPRSYKLPTITFITGFDAYMANNHHKCTVPIDSDGRIPRSYKQPTITFITGFDAYMINSHHKCTVPIDSDGRIPSSLPMICSYHSSRVRRIRS